MKWNGFGDNSAYELSHIAPVKSHDYIGMLFAENLISAPKSLNRAHGTKHYGFGKTIHRLTLNTKYSVDKRRNSASEVRQMVISYLGKELVCSVVKECKIKPTQRSQITEWIISNYNPSNPVHTSALPLLDKVHTLKAKELAHVRAVMQGDEDDEASEYITSPATHPAIVLSKELSRLSAYRPELEVYAYALEEALATQAVYIRQPDYSLFSKHHEQVLFDVLHGKSIAIMADTLEMIVCENTVHAYVTYTNNDDDYYRYNPDAWDYYGNKPRSGGAKLHKTSLAAFKASIGATMNNVIGLGVVQPVQPYSVHPGLAVFDPWGNEVELPPF
jgi:hypothetical protein